MTFFEWLRIIVIGVIEGVTEWLPISSTGHMLLFDALFPTTAPGIFTPDFDEVFLVVIQFGACLAVLTKYFRKLNPFSKQKSGEEKSGTLSLWLKILLGCLPAAVLGVFLDDFISAHFSGYIPIAIMLIVYGVLFIIIERIKKPVRVNTLGELGYKTAVAVGLAQVLAFFPGTSRSGVTILTALLLGCSRKVATEYTFFLALPVILGASALKTVKYFMLGNGFSPMQILVLIIGMAVAYVVSSLVIKTLTEFVKKRDFQPFGLYRIILGIITLIVFSML